MISAVAWRLIAAKNTLIHLTAAITLIGASPAIAQSAKPDRPPTHGNRSVSISPKVRDRALRTLPAITAFQEHKSDRFLVDLNVIRTGHPYLGRRAAKPHTGGHIYFKPLPSQPKPDEVRRFPAIYACADGIISRIDYSFRLKEMYEPALSRRVANTRYGIGLLFAEQNGHEVSMHYSIEPFIDPDDPEFYDRFILVKPGQRVRKGQIIARMYLPPNKQLAVKSHIHFNLTGGRPHRFMAPVIFSDRLTRAFHATWGTRGVHAGQPIPATMGFRLAPDEDPFQH